MSYQKLSGGGKPFPFLSSLCRSLRLYTTQQVQDMGRDAKAPDVITRQYTINLGKAITGITFKKRAPRAVAAVRVSTAKIERSVRERPLSPKRSDRETREGGWTMRETMRTR
jgi:hypothetical protein